MIKRKSSRAITASAAAIVLFCTTFGFAGSVIGVRIGETFYSGLHGGLIVAALAAGAVVFVGILFVTMSAVMEWVWNGSK